MIKDYHTHPQILTTENIHAFVATALERGVQELCITDHMPLNAEPDDRIPLGRAADYCRRVREIAQQYQDQITIRLGMEMDYHPTVRRDIEAILETGDYDYVIGSAHLHVVPVNTFDTVHTYSEFARAMLEDSLQAIQTGHFDTIAHLDFFKWHFTLPHRFPLSGDPFDYRSQASLVEEILDAALEYHVRLELNPHWIDAPELLEERMWPEAWVVQRALDKGVKFAFGSDAHVPERVGHMLPQLRAHPIFGQALRQWENT